MLLMAPFGRLGYLPALALWTALGLAVLLVVARLQKWGPRVLLATLVSPASFFCLISGQNTFLISATLAAIFCLLNRRSIVAGLLIAALTLKPHLGLLFPPALAASGRWRTFMTATIGTIAIAGATAILFGPESWIAFFRDGVPVQSQVLVDQAGIAGPFHSTIFMNLHSTGLRYGFAMAVQGIFTLFSMAALFWVFRRHREAAPYLLLTFFMACTATALPYIMIYDTLPMTLGALLLLESGMGDAVWRVLVRFVYWQPLLQIGFGKLHLPGPAFIAPSLLAILLWSIVRKSPKRQHGDMRGCNDIDASVRRAGSERAVREIEERSSRFNRT